MARLGAPHGVRGWLRFRPYANDPSSLAGRGGCWAAKPGGEWQTAEVETVTQHGNGWLMKLRGADDRDAAGEWRGGQIAVLRSSLPQLPEGAFYWCDLLGLRALAPDGGALGEISDVMEAGGGVVLVVRKSGGGELLAPFNDEYVPRVDIAGGAVTVDIPGDAL